MKTLPHITTADVSLSSSEFTDEDLAQLFAQPFPQLTSLKLNLGSTRISDKGLDFVLNKLPKSIDTLDLSLDAIETVQTSGALVGKLLPNLRNLRSLRLSFILSGLRNEGGIALIQGLRSLNKLENLTLVLMGDDLNGDFGTVLK